MKAPRVYLDTSFFTGLLENVKNRQADAKAVMSYEKQQGSEIYTSFLTLNEFLVPYCDVHRKNPDFIQQTDTVIAEIRGIAWIYGIDDDVARESARLMSVYGEIQQKQKVANPKTPRDRKHRWDSLHIATAHILKATRVYGFDGKGMWLKLPKDQIPNIGTIIIPAKAPQMQLPEQESLMDYVQNESKKEETNEGS